MKSLKFMANLVIIGFVLGRAFNEWQRRARTITVGAGGRSAPVRRAAASEGWQRQPPRPTDPRY